MNQDKERAAIDTSHARVARLKAEIEETCRNPEGVSNGEVVKAIAYYMVEADADLEGSFREFDRMLEDKTTERVSRLRYEIMQVGKDLEAALKAVEILLAKCGGPV
jgi:molecular chaperone GrpE (heat shock protein)